MTDFDLIVVGGGVAGLSSVLNLLKAGFKGRIGLLEARDRLGGRIHTAKTKLQQEKIEYGANWIHGIIDNPVYKILYDAGVLNPVKVDAATSESSKHNVQARMIDGKDVNSYWVNKCCNAYSKMMKRANMLYGLNNQATENLVLECEDSLGKYLEREVDQWVKNEVKNAELEDSIRGLFDVLMKRETCISGCDTLDDVSLKHIGAYEEFLGVHLVIDEGYYSLIECLLHDINQIAKSGQFSIELSSKVTEIVWSGTALPEGSSEPERTKIKTADGRTFTCKQTIVTLPLGVLKHSAKELFKPSLPNDKLESIERLGFDTVDKIFMEYSSKSTIPSVFKTNDDLTHEMMLLWNRQWRQPDDRWFAKIYSIYYISDHCIQLWISGSQARTMEAMKDNEINRQITEQLRLLFNQPDFPLADNIIVTRWSQDEFTRGSYSFIARNSSVADIKTLAHPIYARANDPKPVLAFAGEATHERFFSTVHGALLSGENVAKHFAEK